jgi:hypothetical protein
VHANFQTEEETPVGRVEADLLGLAVDADRQERHVRHGNSRRA